MSEAMSVAWPGTLPLQGTPLSSLAPCPSGKGTLGAPPPSLPHHQPLGLVYTVSCSSPHHSVLGPKLVLWAAWQRKVQVAETALTAG